MSASQIQVLYTNIGRGHPFYLDGIVEDLHRRRVSCDCRDVFSVSGGLSRLAWRGVRRLYRHGSSPGFTSGIYRYLRRDTDYDRVLLSAHLLGRSLRSHYLTTRRPLVVAHPSLVGILRGHQELYYQHGELVTPREAVVGGAHAVFVPTEEAARPFLTGGYRPEQVVVSGLCIERAIVDQAESAYAARQARLGRIGPLTGAFFSSGAEPREHVRSLVLAIRSVIRAGGRGVVMAHDQGRLHHALTAAAPEIGAPLRTVRADTQNTMTDTDRLLLALFTSRSEEDLLSRTLFVHWDYLVAPPHERTNWALGLGLPMFIIGPCIGPFAPLNRDLLLAIGAGQPVDDPAQAESLGTAVLQLQKSGAMVAMGASGWGHHPITGFERIGAVLAQRIEPQADAQAVPVK